MADARLAQLPVVEGAIRIGTVDVEVAPYSAGSLVAYNTDASFERIGIIEPGSLKPEAIREFFKLERGLPKSLVKKVVIGQSMNVPLDLSEYTQRAVEIANGGTAMTRTTANATTIKTATTPSTTTLELTTATGYALNKWVAITIASLGRTFDRKIKSISSGVITFDALPTTPVVGDAVATISEWQLAGGGSTVMEFTMRLVYVDTYGDKAIVYLPRVSTAGKFAPDFKADANAVLPIEFDVHAVQSVFNGITDYWLYHHYLIPAA